MIRDQPGAADLGPCAVPPANASPPPGGGPVVVLRCSSVPLLDHTGKMLTCGHMAPARTRSGRLPAFLLPEEWGPTTPDVFCSFTCRRDHVEYMRGCGYDIRIAGGLNP